jgi:hypothetical protein
MIFEENKNNFHWINHNFIYCPRYSHFEDSQTGPFRPSILLVGWPGKAFLLWGPGEGKNVRKSPMSVHPRLSAETSLLRSGQGKGLIFISQWKREKGAN